MVDHECVSTSTGTSSVKVHYRDHGYQSPDRTQRKVQKMRDHHSVQDEYLLGHHPVDGSSAIHYIGQQLSHQFDRSYQPLYHNISPGGPQQPFEQDDDDEHRQGVIQRPQLPLPTQQGSQQVKAWLQPYGDNQLSQDVLTGAVALQETISHSFSIGSSIQLLSDPPCYGVIQWIGTLPGINEGHIAGVELVSSSWIRI